MNPAGVSRRRRRRRGTVRVRPRVDIEWARRYGPAPAVVVRRSVDGVCGCHSSCGVDMLNARMFVVVRSTNVRFHIDDVVQTGVVVRLQCEGKELFRNRPGVLGLKREDVQMTLWKGTTSRLSLNRRRSSTGETAVA